MSIKRTENSDLSDDEKQSFTFENGDKEALSTIKKKWKFKDEESALRFALAVLVRGDPSTINVKAAGQELTVRPSEDLLEKT